MTTPATARSGQGGGQLTLTAKVFVTEFKREADRLRRLGRQGDEDASARLRVVEAELANLALNLTAGAVGPTILSLIGEREAEKVILQEQLATAPRPVPQLTASHGDLVKLFKEKVADLQASLSDSGTRTEAAKIIKELVEFGTPAVRAALSNLAGAVT